MTDEEKDDGAVLAFFKKISTKVKLALAAIGAVLGFLLIVIFRSRVNQVKMLEYELKKIKHEIEIEKASEEVSINDVRINELKEKEEEIKRKIWEIDNRELSGDVSREELDKFFDERGF